MPEQTFSEKVKLHKDYLDDDAVEQPSLAEETGRMWAEAVLVRDKAKDNLAVVRAQINKKVRNNLAVYGWIGAKDPTVSWFEDQLILDPEYQEAQEELNQTQYNVNILVTGKDSVESRGKALDVLAKLYTSSYFSSKPKDLGKGVEDQSRQAQEEQLGKSTRLMKKKV